MERTDNTNNPYKYDGHSKELFRMADQSRDEFIMDGLHQITNMYLERRKQALKNDHKIQSNQLMIYECENCGACYIMQLEEGLEDESPDRKPVPFIILCIVCSGSAKHTYTKLLKDQYRLGYHNFFWNDPNKDHGIPVLFEPDFYKCFDYVEQDIQATMEFVIEHMAEVDAAQNRKTRRHPEGHDSWKRPRKNKKLYEY